MNKFRPPSARGKSSLGSQDTSSSRGELQSSFRPVTQQGLSGAGYRPQTGVRHVHDVQFYISQINKKCQDIEEEKSRLVEMTRRMKEKVAQKEKEEERNMKLKEEVEMLREELADYNLALDKYQDGFEAKKLQNISKDLEEKNKELEARVDENFILQQEKESELRERANTLKELNKKVEERLDNFGSHQKEKFLSLKRKTENLKQELKEKEEETKEMKDELKEKERQIFEDKNLHRYKELEGELEIKEKQYNQLQEEFEVVKVDDTMIKSFVLDKIKQKNIEIKILQKGTEEQEL
eukprot:snap_masked-scaffold_35-processed-gene-2.20-mRNA-1 protein AED:1.00 eAED:1.00 QI:0/-1/0/0/-1/1/1/0/294